MTGATSLKHREQRDALPPGSGPCWYPMTPTRTKSRIGLRVLDRIREAQERARLGNNTIGDEVKREIETW